MFWKEFSISDPIKNICDPWEGIEISPLTGVWKKLIPVPPDDFDRVKFSVAKVTADVVKIATELEIGVQTEEVIRLLHLMI